MSPGKELAVVPHDDYSMEFRAYNDDAWYSVAISLEGHSLRVKYLNFPDDHDNLFKTTEFESLEELEGFKERFRPLSKQLQDNECRRLLPGVKVCACYTFAPDDIRFYDALVDGVQENEHSYNTEELCLCTFILFWLHGPNAKSLTATTIENICIVQPIVELDHVVTSFLEMAREKIEFTPPRPISMSKKDSGREMVAYSNKGSKSDTAHKLGYLERQHKARRRARRSVVKISSSEVSHHDRRTGDNDLQGTKQLFMILISNLDKDLCPSAITEFLCKHASISAARVFIFPSLTLETYTRGAIVLNSEKDFQKLCVFLNNPNYIITSSAGRPWVIIETLVGLKNIKASIGTLMSVSENTLRNENRGKSSLKVVCSGTQEFKIAGGLRDLFLTFSDHQERLYKRLALEEGRIFDTRSFAGLD